jgi:hypothetical protein
MPIKGGFKGGFSWIKGHDVPELTPMAIHPSIQAERDKFDTKAMEYIKSCHVSPPEALSMLGDLKRTWALYENYAANHDELENAFLTTDKREEVKALVERRDPGEIGVYIIREYKEERAKNLPPLPVQPVMYNSPTEVETSSVGGYNVLLEEGSGNDQKHGMEEAGVALFGASAAPHVDETSKCTAE